MVKSYSVIKLNRISKNKEIWCFGCGKRLNDLLGLYEKEAFVRKITALIDNNKLLWGKRKKVGEKQITIKSPDIIKNQGNENIILLITSDRYDEIYSQQLHALSKAGMQCIRYPICYDSYLNILRFLFRLLPMRRQILFNSGKEPYENTKAIVDYLINKYEGKSFKLVFIVDDKIRPEEYKELVFLYRNTLKTQCRFLSNVKYCFYSATSKYLLYENEPLKKERRGQVLIYLNHGTIPLKNVADVLRQPKELDYAICPSEGCSEIYRQQYGIPKKKQLYITPPRTVYLTEKVQKLNRIMELPNKQVIIWLPTFRALKGTDRRDSTVNSALPLITNGDDFLTINARLGKNGQVLVIKSHPLEKFAVSIPTFCENIKILKEEDLKENDIVLQEVLADSSALLTDYSGISFEYLLLNRPIGYVISDIDRYTRGFAFEHISDYMPGEMIKTLTELMCFFDDVLLNKDKYKKERRKLQEKIFRRNENKNGAEELVKRLDQLR